MKWTPVTEALPAESGEYLVTTKFGHITHDSDIEIVWYFNGKDERSLKANIQYTTYTEDDYLITDITNEGFCTEDRNDSLYNFYNKHNDVIAWAPLPEPYK